MLALQARPNLRSNANSIANLAQGDLVSHPEYLSDNLVADADGVRRGAPAGGKGVHVRLADATSLNFNVDVVGFEGLGLVLALMEGGPAFGALDEEAGEGIGVAHSFRYSQSSKYFLDFNTQRGG